MKEFLENISKQKSSLLIILGVVLVVLGISSGVKWGENSVAIEPAYRVTGIVIGILLIITGVIFSFADSESFPRKNKDKSLGALANHSVVARESFLKVSQIDVMGYSLRNFIHNNQQTLVQAVINGASRLSESRGIW